MNQVQQKEKCFVVYIQVSQRKLIISSDCESFQDDSTDVLIPEDPMSDSSQETDGCHAISSDVEITDNVLRSADCTGTIANLCMQNTEELASDILYIWDYLKKSKSVLIILVIYQTQGRVFHQRPKH